MKTPHLEIEGDWLVEVVNYHTCGAGPGSGAGHEPGCGMIPIGRLATPEHDAAVAAKALREVAAGVRQLPREVSPVGIAAAIAIKANRIERGVTDA